MNLSEFKKKRIIILGANGFIGSALNEQLSQRPDFEMVGFSSLECDLLSLQSTQAALADLTANDTVIMTSAITRLLEDSFEAMIKNIKMVEHLIRTIGKKPLQQFIYLSSTDVYGNSVEAQGKVDENSALQPDGYYGIGKLACEFLLQKSFKDQNTRLAILRSTGLYGPHPKDRCAPGRFIRAALENGKITIYGQGEQLRNYVYIDDFCKIVEGLIDFSFDGILNISHPKSDSVLRLAEMIQSSCERDCHIEFIPEAAYELQRQKQNQLDDAKLKELFPEFEFTEFSDGIKRYIQQYKKNYLSVSSRGITNPYDEAAKELRRRIVDVICHAGAGHIPSSFSIVDLIYFLYDKILQCDPRNPQWDGRDYFILSKGHGCVALYVVLEKLGFIPSSDLDELITFEGILGGHPDSTKIPGVEASTGSLGHGLATAIGIALGLRIKSLNNKVIVLIGDGESNEGTIWEGALVAPHLQLGNLCCIVDNNGSTGQVLPMPQLKEKWEAFGWETYVIDGHKFQDMERVFKQIHFQHHAKPKLIIANTVKGKGVSFMEMQGTWHYRLPNSEELNLIYKELEECRR